MPLSPDQMGAAIIRNLPTKTGKTLEEWIAIVLREGPPATHERVEWLKRTHGLGPVQAQIIVSQAETPPDAVGLSPQDLIAAQYAGEKAELWPVYERLSAAALSLGSDVSLEARKTYVALVRRRQFGLIQVSTRERVDLGLSLPGIPPEGRLEVAGSFGTQRTTHRVRLKTLVEVDDDVIRWLRQAYELGG